MATQLRFGCVTDLNSRVVRGRTRFRSAPALDIARHRGATRRRPRHRHRRSMCIIPRHNAIPGRRTRADSRDHVSRAATVERVRAPCCTAHARWAGLRRPWPEGTKGTPARASRSGSASPAETWRSPRCLLSPVLRRAIIRVSERSDHLSHHTASVTSPTHVSHKPLLHSTYSIGVPSLPLCP